MKKYITSDWHLDHKNICGADGFVSTREHFTSVDDMNEHIISAINSVVTNSDELYHLGDIGMNNKPKRVFELLCQIKGQIHLFKGNHDGSKVLKYIKNHNFNLPDGREKFVVYEVGTIVKRNGVQYYLTHYPMGLGEYRRKMRSICGHIHEQEAREANCINVGIDSPELPVNQPFAVPIELDTAMDLVDTKWNKWFEQISRLTSD